MHVGYASALGADPGRFDSYYADRDSLVEPPMATALWNTLH